ncbi:O-antigen ligase [Aestuariibacter sp. A3R04]|uniref:O-antigen ligase family protein n=1 Tax=Aestuariibacter sp. A3R04 TaxID=2841571 RepID=UPI001C08E8B0|nr:O-antigen ligase family protein [Aestuariibacter sp. A3R04]MBU3020910.1 O-antigen ligase family protein [Aestuariibacter sp. A3R04]
MKFSSVKECGLLAILSVVFVVFPWLHGLDLVWEQLLAASFILLFASLGLLFCQFHITRNRVIALSLWSIWVVYNTIYLMPLPVSLIEFLSPKVPFWYAYQGLESAPHLTVYWQASLIEWVKFLALALLFFALLLFVNTSRRITGAIIVIFSGAAITSLYSICNFITAGEYELVNAIPPWNYSWKDGIRGTFSYKNQYAIYLGIAALLGIGLLLDTLKDKRKRWLSFALLFFIAAMAYTLINTSSRGALLSVIAGLAASILLYMLRQPRIFTLLFSARTALICAVVVGVLVFAFMQSSMYHRFSEDQLDDNGRNELRQTVQSVIRDHPLLGSGPGTYPYIQHIYKPVLLGNSKMSKRAHNDYLETIATTGIVGFLLLLLPVGWLLIRQFKVTNTPHPGILFGCRAATISYLSQATFDTNAGIFFLPVLFVSLLSIGFILGEGNLTIEANAHTEVL